MVASLLTALVVFLFVLTPFMLGAGGLLASASSEQSTERLKRIKDALVERYLTDERSFANNEISQRAWKARQSYLRNRYIDAARRLDYLESVQQHD